MKLARGNTSREGGLLAWLVILLIAAGAFFAYRRVPAPSKAAPTDGPPPNQIVMNDVRIEIFDESFRQTAELRGKTATTFKDSSDLVLEPADCVLIREHGHNVHITSTVARKVVQRGQPDHLDFTGDVNVESAGRKLLSEKLTYTPNSRLLESGAPVTIKTTGSVILGDHLKSQTDLKTGTIDGDVQITSFGEGGRALDAPMLVRGKRSEFNLDRGLYDVIGSAWAKKTDSEIKADKMSFNRKRNTLTADGNAVASKPEVVVKAGHLEYWIDREAGTATENPKAVMMTPRTTSEDETRSDLVAKSIEMDFKHQILEGKEDVSLQRLVKFEGDWEPDYKIRAKSVTSLYAKGRSTFKDDVKIEASKVGAEGDRAIFYQGTGKLYIIGHAKAWEFDDDHQKLNPIEGDKLLHDLHTNKTRVLGNFRGEHNDTEAPPRKRNTGPGGPKKRVEIKFNEGGTDE